MEPNQPRSNIQDQTANRNFQSASEATSENKKGSLGEVVDDLKTEAVERTQSAKESVAEEVSGLASVLRNAADELRSGSPQERTLGQIANGLADASEAIRDKDLGEIVHSVSDFARRNPAMFLGASVLLGFAATRFVKASSGSQASANESEGAASRRAETTRTTSADTPTSFVGERT